MPDFIWANKHKITFAFFFSVFLKYFFFNLLYTIFVAFPSVLTYYFLFTSLSLQEKPHVEEREK